jgi:hypothetical protein
MRSISENINGDLYLPLAAVGDPQAGFFPLLLWMSSRPSGRMRLSQQLLINPEIL